MCIRDRLRKLLREFLDLAKGRAVGHQCGGGHDAVRVCLNDGPIYAGCESEIVRINHETPHPGSLAGRPRTCCDGRPTSGGHLSAVLTSSAHIWSPSFSSCLLYTSDAADERS